MFLLPCSSSPLSSKSHNLQLSLCTGCPEILSERKSMCDCDCERNNSLFLLLLNRGASSLIHIISPLRSVLTRNSDATLRSSSGPPELKCNKCRPWFHRCKSALSACRSGRIISHAQRGLVFVIFIPSPGCEEEKREDEQRDGEDIVASVSTRRRFIPNVICMTGLHDGLAETSCEDI